jgi:hypothetical protein
MAHESFEDPDTADEMNRLYVNVKVDREERPDVDSIYMEAVQTMTGRGGWPMTVWLTPNGRPFYAGTYFPAEDRHGLPSFRTVMRAVSSAWENKRDEVLTQSDRLTDAINRSIPVTEDVPDVETLTTAYGSLAASFDPINGGFGTAPKFPQQPVLEFLLRSHSESWAPRADHMLKVSLAEMADGGIHDQLAGGFARYSVDDQWLVPHFEKMLYDNAQLARLYLWAGIELGEERFIEVARSTLNYLVTDMRHPEGGFYSAEDADSEGVEGKFYVWTSNELEQVLGPADAALAARYFGATPHGNFEGTNILHRPGVEPWTDQLEKIRLSLLEHRNTRVRPGLDDKVVAAWNGLAIRAFAEAGAALDDDSYLAVARSTARFLLDQMVANGELRRSWRRGQCGGGAFLEDHAALATGLFAIYAATGELEWFQAAEKMTLSIPKRFSDPDGGFFDTPVDGETLIKRPKSPTDNPSPSGNALAAEALLILAGYTGSAEHRDLAINAVRAVGALMGRYPSMVGHHLAVLHSMLTGKELAVVGNEPEQFSRVFWERFRPNVILAISNDDTEPIPLLSGRSVPGRTLAYVCQGHVCDLPTSDPGMLREQLLA